MDACKAYKEGDIPQGSWRTPTQKELLLIWALREQLKPHLQNEAFNTTFLVATRIGMTYNALYYVKKEAESSIKSGDVTAWYKDGFYVRCVRDL